jgi:putative transposase
MPRGNRLSGDGGIFHVTHRCHNKVHLLRFARDRDAYRAKLMEHLPQYDVSILDYCLTSNHVHLLLDAPERSEISGYMQAVAGESARSYNCRKKRSNSFWGDTYHATIVEGGMYLWNCLVYIELNMVRAGVVRHPQEWPWVGYHEIMGHRRRYRLIDLERLCWRLGQTDLAAVKRNLEASLEQTIGRDELKRQSHWTESLAVGSSTFLQKIRPSIQSRCEIEIL